MPFTPELTPEEVQTLLQPKFSHLRPLSEGGQGAVFRAASADGSEVALKIYSCDQLAERAAREIEALKALQFPTIVQLRGSGTCNVRGDACVWLAYDFIEGHTLGSRISSGKVELHAAARIAHDIADAIRCLWEQRIVHRDIKPDNIMLASNHRAVLIDLGVARHVSKDALTTTGGTWGTEGYLSPEQMDARQQLTCKSDVFTLGIVLQESIMGKHPTGHRQMPLRAGGATLAQLRADLPAEFTEVIDRMVSPQASRRPLPSDVITIARKFIGAQSW